MTQVIDSLSAEIPTGIKPEDLQIRFPEAKIEDGCIEMHQVPFNTYQVLLKMGFSPDVKN